MFEKRDTGQVTLVPAEHDTSKAARLKIKLRRWESLVKIHKECGRLAILCLGAIYDAVLSVPAPPREIESPGSRRGACR